MCRRVRVGQVPVAECRAETSFWKDCWLCAREEDEELFFSRASACRLSWWLEVGDVAVWRLNVGARWLVVHAMRCVR